MKALRPANTVRLIVLIALSAGLAFGSFWLVEVMRRQTDDTLPTKQRSEPDFYA
jgi:lipopolysaccharide export system protein LptC